MNDSVSCDREFISETNLDLGAFDNAPLLRMQNLNAGAHFPIDIFYEIVWHLNTSHPSRADLYNVMLTCRMLHGITLPFLYQRIRLGKYSTVDQCLSVLSRSTIAASSVVDLGVTLARPKHGDDGTALPFLPLVAEALLHTPNLQHLKLGGLVYEKEHYELFFERAYTFQLLSLAITSSIDQDTWEYIIPFLNRQVQLHHLSFHHPPHEDLLYAIALPKLESVGFMSPINKRGEKIQLDGFFARFPGITDVAARFYYSPVMFRRSHTVTGVLQFSPNLRSLSIKLADGMDWGNTWPKWTDIRSQNLHFLTVLLAQAVDTTLDPVIIDSLPKNVLLNMKSIFIEFSFPSISDLTQCFQYVTWRAEIGRIKFYFGLPNEKVMLATQRDDKQGWRVEEVRWAAVPHPHRQAVARSDFF